jgi:hypothetical protein
MAVVDESLVDDLIKSHAAASSGGDGFVYTHSNQGAILLLADKFYDVFSGDYQSFEALGFEISNPSGALLLTSPLSRGLVISAHGIVISAPSEEIELGPDLTIVAQELEIIGRRLSAIGEDSSGGTSGVVLVCRNIRHDGSISVSSNPSNALEVSWPNMWHIWQPYKLATPEGLESIQPDSLWQLITGIRRVLMSFRQSIEEPSCNIDKMHNVVVGKSSYVMAVLEVLIELGIIDARDRRTIYGLHLDQLTRYGIDYATLKSGDFARSFEALISDLIKTRSVSVLLQQE